MPIIYLARKGARESIPLHYGVVFGNTYGGHNFAMIFTNKVVDCPITLHSLSVSYNPAAAAHVRAHKQLGMRSQACEYHYEVMTHVMCCSTVYIYHHET